MQEKPVYGDGNCLYYSVALALLTNHIREPAIFERICRRLFGEFIVDLRLSETLCASISETHKSVKLPSGDTEKIKCQIRLRTHEVL